MHVLLLAENWPPRVGGIENYLTHIARHLPAGSVTVVAPRTAGAADAATGGIKQVIRRRFFWPALRPAWLPLFIWLWRFTTREQVDLILCGKGLFEGLAAYYLKRHRNIPYIVCTYATEIETWQQRGATRRALARVLHAADRVVYINDRTRGTLRSLGVTDAQLVKIWPGVDQRFLVEISQSEQAAVLQRHGVKPPYLITVARLVPRKGVDTLIEAFAQLDQTKFGDVQLVVVGEGPERSQLEQQAQQLLIGRSVRFLGAVPNADLPALYRSATLFALTPREVAGDFEGFGIVYLEAAASGLTSIATRTGGAAEAVVHQQTGLVVEPDSVAAVHDSLVRLLSDAAERHRLAATARQRVEQQFRWRKRILLVKGMIDTVVMSTHTQPRAKV